MNNLILRSLDDLPKKAEKISQLSKAFLSSKTQFEKTKATFEKSNNEKNKQAFQTKATQFKTENDNLVNNLIEYEKERVEVKKVLFRLDSSFLTNTVEQLVFAHMTNAELSWHANAIQELTKMMGGINSVNEQNEVQVTLQSR